MQVRYRSRSKNKFDYNSLYIVLIPLVLIMITVFLVLIIKNSFALTEKKNELKAIHANLFNSNKIDELIDLINKDIENNLFEPEFLVYRGYAYFLKGEDNSDIFIKQKFFNLALLDLRKALALGVPEKNLANIYFTLAKIYFVKGFDYYNQSIDYFNRSILAGNSSRADLFFIMSVIYANSGDLKTSIDYLLKSYTIEKNEVVLYSLANNYFKIEDYNKSLLFINELIKSSDNQNIIENSYLLAGEIFFIKNEYDEALSNFDRVISINENNFTAYFYRGEIFAKKNNLVSARAQWRKTLEINPSHIKALNRLY